MASRAQIIATIGPATKNLELIQQLIAHQMDVARLNFAWGSYEEHALYIQNIRQAAQEAGRQIPIIQDLAGPRKQSSRGHRFDAAQELITPKDLNDLTFGIKQGVDYIALSYVASGPEIKQLRQEIKNRGGSQPIIAKIERKEALHHLPEIIQAADAVMVARGDLGQSIPLEQVPFAQHQIIKLAKKAHKPVIVATQMLLSMTQNPQPTRAEVSDVAHAILDGADAVMLSEETATGHYPIEAVMMMEKIILEAEKHMQPKIKINPLRPLKT